MQNLTIDRLASMIRTGSVTEVHANPNPMDSGWIIDVGHHDPMLSNQVMTARGEVRVFKTADALIRTMVDAGWRDLIRFYVPVHKG